MNKKVLLIAGGGTLGTYTAKELLSKGVSVEVVCPEEKTSDNENLKFHRTLATDDFLTDLFAKNHYDAIVNFIHYEDVEEYRRVHPLLIANTDQLVFLSSYRVYADQVHPVNESAPRLYDVVRDEEFFEYERYAVPKSKCEDFLLNERAKDPFTIVRPVISFSERRLDLVMNSGRWPIEAMASGCETVLPESVRNLHAGVDWAGNSGKLIANLLFKRAALGEAFNVYSGHGMTWGEVADAYCDVFGIKIRWGTDEEYKDTIPTIRTARVHRWMWKYDRQFDRQIDATKVLSVTGLKRNDFASIREGLEIELERIKGERV